MQYLLILIVGLWLFIEMDRLKKQVKSQQTQIDSLCKHTQNEQLAKYYISEEDKACILQLKNSGKAVEAIKKVREITAMELLEAKQYVDAL